jgi:hypothetical protein
VVPPRQNRHLHGRTAGAVLKSSLEAIAAPQRPPLQVARRSANELPVGPALGELASFGLGTGRFTGLTMLVSIFSSFLLFDLPARHLLFTGDIQARGLEILKLSTSGHNSIMTYRVKFFGPLAPQIIAAKGNKVRTALY